MSTQEMKLALAWNAGEVKAKVLKLCKETDFRRREILLSEIKNHENHISILKAALNKEKP